ncbi:MAG: ABC transporter substrate-binding protein [Desulfobacteraceae bacterium]|nr:ABC transporter substrate-binding protein [Desulfobacteraceae bacterium]
MGKRIISDLIAVLFLFFVFSFGAMAETGVTGTEIHIGSFGPMTGPAAMWGDVVRGSELVFNMVNDEGGIHGRRVVFHWFDDRYNPAKTQATVKRLMETSGIFAWQGGVGTETGLAVIDYLSNNDVPWVGPVSGTDQWVTPPRKNVFAIYPHYYLEAKTLCGYAIDELDKKRVAIVYQNDAYGKSGLKGAAEELALRNMNLYRAIPVDINKANMASIISQLKKDSADSVLLWLTPFHALQVLSKAKKMNFSTQWMASSSLSDFGKMYKISRGLINGLIAANFADYSNKALLDKYQNAYDTYYHSQNKRGNDEFIDIKMKDYNKEQLNQANGFSWGMNFHAGIAFAEPVVEALKRCGRDVTRERFIQELEGLNDFRGIGPLLNYKPFDLSDPTCRQGTEDVHLVQCLWGGKIKVLTN